MYIGCEYTQVCNCSTQKLLHRFCVHFLVQDQMMRISYLDEVGEGLVSWWHSYLLLDNYRYPPLVLNLRMANIQPTSKIGNGTKQLVLT